MSLKAARAKVLWIASASALVCVWLTCSRPTAQSANPILLTVDETDAPRQLTRVHEDIPVTPGALTLAYPKWIPGEHAPSGPIQRVGSLQIRAGAATLPWTRDTEDLYSFRVDVPAGVSQVAVDFDVVFENTISEHQLLLAWNTALLYPRGADKTTLMVAPAVQLPAGWTLGCSLRVASHDGARTAFAPVSLERLIDSPVLAGRFYRSIPLAASWPSELDVTAESQAALDRVNDAHAVDTFRALVDEDRAMFGFRHWASLRILVSESDERPYDGLEHADAPYNAVPDEGLSKRDVLEHLGAPLLAHEQSHSWVGKYRRPAGLYSKPDYQGPEETSLLWVYEGLNQYVSTVLATRAGFNDAAYARDELASWASFFSHQSARATTALIDTAVASPVLRAPGAWEMLHRAQDYYFEGALVWLEADAIIRARSNGQRSLDDFLRSFFGQRDSGPVVVPYTRQDVESALSGVTPYDWRGFFERRVYQVNPAPPTAGLDAAGWKLTYSAEPNRDRFLPRNVDRRGMLRDSVGMLVANDGTIVDVVPDSPAFRANLGPHSTITAVDGRAFSLENLIDAVSHPSNGRIALLVRRGHSIDARELAYAGGLRYPHLERVDGTPDYLDGILKEHRPSR